MDARLELVTNVLSVSLYFIHILKSLVVGTGKIVPIEDLNRIVIAN